MAQEKETPPPPPVLESPPKDDAFQIRLCKAITEEVQHSPDPCYRQKLENLRDCLFDQRNGLPTTRPDGKAYHPTRASVIFVSLVTAIQALWDQKDAVTLERLVRKVEWVVALRQDPSAYVITGDPGLGFVLERKGREEE